MRERVTCGAKTRSGAPCKGIAMANGRCRMHGGATPVGPAVHTWKTGRYSKYLPRRMQEAYERATQDMDLLMLRDEISVVEARIADLLGRVNSGESGELWDRTLAVVHAMQDANARKDTAAFGDAFRDLVAVTGRGHSDAAGWREIGVLLEQKRRLVESEQRRMVAAEQTIEVGQALALVSALSASVVQHVPDPHARAAISRDLLRLLGPGDGRADP